MMKLCLGVLLLCVTILWWVHMYQYLHKNSILFIIVRKNGFPYHPFLNKMFTELEAYNVNFIGVFFFGFFTLYLLWCVTKGNIKVGLRIPFLFTMHPMKLNGTWMNSFLFNIVLILYSSVAVTHFSTTCFSQYLRHTTIAHLFGIQVRYLTMLSWALDNRVFEFALFGWSLLAAMVQCGLSMSAPGVLAEIEAKRQAQKKKNNNVEIELKEYLI
jgi:LMBR1 domain-containing protein 1